MIDRLLNQIAPHSCYGCGEVGSVLCVHCANDIIDEPFLRCIFCLRVTSHGSICGMCAERYAIRGAWCVGARRGALLASLDAYKFERAKAAALEFAQLLHASVPVVDQECVVTAIPTTPAHIRARGYDHAALIAQAFARLCNLPYQPLLERKSSGTQHFSSRRDRFLHAKQAFTLRAPCPAVFLIDDIVTTGATLEAAVELLVEGGATKVYVGVIARQPLDDNAHLW